MRQSLQISGVDAAPSTPWEWAQLTAAMTTAQAKYDAARTQQERDEAWHEVVIATRARDSKSPPLIIKPDVPQVTQSVPPPSDLASLLANPYFVVGALAVAGLYILRK